MKKKNPEKKGANPARILIVDDHPVVRQGLGAMIDQQPDLKICAEAESYHQALAAIEEKKPDLAIVDLTLEDIGGLDLIKQIRSHYPELPTLVLSMHDESIYAERALRAGARGYIMKQRGTDKLIVAIRMVLSGEIYVSEAMASRMLGKFVGRPAAAANSPVDRLSDRELEVFGLLGGGLGTREIADRLCISVKTVESHREHIKEKLGLRTANELVRHATQWVLETSGGIGGNDRDQGD